MIQGVAGHLEQLGREEGLLGDVRARLPAHTRLHCVHASTKGEILTLTLDSSSWATRVRYSEGDLLGAFAALGITAVKLRVRPVGRASARKVARPVAVVRKLTPAAVSHLLEAADHIADQGLADALRRLANGWGPGVAD